MTNDPNVLIVDDEPNALRVLSAILEEASYNVYKADCVDKAEEILSAEVMDTVITDLKMPGKDGMYLFNFLNSKYPEIPVIFLTAFGTVDSAVTAMTDGAFYYLIKPRSEEHTSELQSHSFISYAVFCLKKKNSSLNFHLGVPMSRTGIFFIMILCFMF